MPSSFQLLQLLTLGLATVACGGAAEPPARPPKIEAVRPTVEKAPPPSAKPKRGN